MSIRYTPEARLRRWSSLMIRVYSSAGSPSRSRQNPGVLSQAYGLMHWFFRLRIGVAVSRLD